MNSISNEEFPGPYTQEKQLSINDLLKPTPKCIEINNGVVYEIRKNSASDEIATKTLAELGKENEEFKKTNSESLRKKVQYVYNKIKLLKRKGNADVLDKYAKSTFSPHISKLDCLEIKQKKLVETVQEKAKCVASENKQLKRRLEEHSQEIESLEVILRN